MFVEREEMYHQITWTPEVEGVTSGVVTSPSIGDQAVTEGTAQKYISCLAFIDKEVQEGMKFGLFEGTVLKFVVFAGDCNARIGDRITLATNMPPYGKNTDWIVIRSAIPYADLIDGGQVQYMDFVAQRLR